MRPAIAAIPNTDRNQFQLFLEELCCDLSRFEHIERHGIPPHEVRIRRDTYLGAARAFADIRVDVAGQLPYFIEVKFGYPAEMVIRRLKRKYGDPRAAIPESTRLILAIDTASRDDWPHLERAIRDCLRPGIQLEVWSERDLAAKVEARFGVHVEAFTPETLLTIREAVNFAKMRQAFGEDASRAPDLLALNDSLLWHFGFWRLGEICEGGHLGVREILPPGLYPEIVILLADLCSFSSYVRDTPDPSLVRDCLTSFYSKARYEIINRGGMMYQFVGDEVIGLFGVPSRRTGYIEAALETAQALVDIGNSISNRWQRELDRVQVSGGLHIGMAMGDLQVVSLQPFGHSHMGVIGDAINLAARLMATAGPSEIVVSNGLYQRFMDDQQAHFSELNPVEARNMGRIKSWKTIVAQSAFDADSVG